MDWNIMFLHTNQELMKNQNLEKLFKESGEGKFIEGAIYLISKIINRKQNGKQISHQIQKES
jgi:hypothetical protein